MEKPYYVEYEEERRLSKQNYWEDDNGAALKLEGSRDQRTLLVNIQRLIQVIAYNNARVDPESTRFGTNALIKTEEKNIASRVGAEYQKLVVEFVRGVGYFDGFAAFQEEVLLPLLLTHKKTQYSIAALLSKSAKKGTEFEDISGKSIVENAKKAIRGFARLEKKFHKLLGPSASPPSGVQWSDLLAGFRRMLYADRENRDKKVDPVEEVNEEGSKSGDEFADRKESRLAPLLDNINESVPAGWLPNSEYSSAWLVFVYFGPYGRQAFGSPPLYVLSNLNAQQLGAVKYGRSETRSRKPHQEVNSAVDKIMENDAKREEREARKEMFEHLRRKLERQEKRIWFEHAMIQEEADSLREQLDETRKSIERQSTLIMTYKTLLNDPKIELDFREGLVTKIQKLTEKTSNGEDTMSTLEEQYREVRTNASESKRRCHDRVDAFHKEYEREVAVADATFSNGKGLKHLSSGVLHDCDDSNDEVSSLSVCCLAQT